jgi:ubiquinone/menaquinone biosynthesis C-methylase UbiE
VSGWQKLWQDPEVVRKWAGALPVDEVVAMADQLEAAGRRRVLDIGCGLGRHTIYLAARGFEVVGVDNASAALAGCRQRLSEAGLEAVLVEAEMTESAFPDGSFDGVVAAYVIPRGAAQQPAQPASCLPR